MNKILIKERINGSYAVSYEMAQKCLPEIKEVLSKSDQVVLDFTGVSIVSSPFLSGTIGLLVKDYSIEEVKQKVLLTHIPGGTEGLIDTVLKNAAAFYREK